MKNLIKKITTLFLAIFLSFSTISFGNLNLNLINTTHAANQDTQSYNIFKPRNLPGPSFQENNPSTKDKQRTILNEFLPKFSIRLLVFITIASLIGMIYGGFLYISDLGAEQNLEQAKKAITFSIVGLIVAFLSFAIVQIINVIPLDFI